MHVCVCVGVLHHVAIASCQSGREPIIKVHSDWSSDYIRRKIARNSDKETTSLINLFMQIYLPPCNQPLSLHLSLLILVLECNTFLNLSFDDGNVFDIFIAHYTNIFFIIISFYNVNLNFKIP